MTLKARLRCFECRKIRQKCDGARPDCGRCKSSNHPCPGYPDPVFRYFGSASNTEASSQQLTQTRTVTADQKVARDSSRIFRSLSRDWAHEAICYFFSAFVVATPNPTVAEGYLVFLPDMYARDPENVQLKESLEAVSLYVYGRRARVPELTRSSDRAYGNALRTTGSILRDNKNLAKSDESLAAIFLLSIYEILTAQIPNLDNPHVDVQEELLASSESYWSKSSANRNLHRIVSTRKQMRALNTQRSTLGPYFPSRRDRGSSQAEVAMMYPSRATAHLFALLENVQKVCSTLRNWGKSSITAITCSPEEDYVFSSTNRSLTLIETLNQARRLDNDLLSWQRMEWVNLEYGVQKQKRQLAGENLAFPPYTTIFKSILYSVFWLRLWNGRLQLADSILQKISIYLSSTVDFDHALVTQTQETREEAIEEIAAIVPFLLGDTTSLASAPFPSFNQTESCVNPLNLESIEDGGPGLGDILATWGLHVIGKACGSDAYCSPGMLERRRKWVLECLEGIGLNHGVLKAYVVRDELINKWREA